MATHKLATPMHVGDLTNGITVDALDLVSISVNFQPVVDSEVPGAAKGRFWRDRVVVSCMLHHAASGWIHTVTLSEHTATHKEAKAMWAAIKNEFPDFEKKILTMLAPYLPPGTIS